ncbi:MAG: T9SS type A sorting domain-containing protein, partial [Bacteroidales bacterium]|nr:T9SS type A sorting domain-containing protein [Bacteroidales bacterium]
NIQSNNNIYYPEQAGFITIASTVFNNLQHLQQAMKIDMNSFISDPAFVDIYNENFLLAENSPAINAGIDLNLGIDLLGGSVPLSGAADIGVHEFTGAIVPQENHIEPTLLIYPNPSSGNINVVIQMQSITTEIDYVICNKVSNIKIYDQFGKAILTQIISCTENIIHENFDLSSLSNGMYFIVYEILGKTISEKLIINR